MVNRFKGRSSRLMRQEFPALRSRLPTLWSRSYYAGSVGHVSAETVQAGSVAISDDRQRNARVNGRFYAASRSNCSASEQCRLWSYFACPFRIM
ncbi:IS200/IS605 family transposase [Microvirga sp. Mcv34]|uniref:IS200/IS605 family transposase n=1 Tax=Microvirga sp. Mcv34 TaxID=2926016 RepID=UPI0039677BF4